MNSEMTNPFLAMAEVVVGLACIAGAIFFMNVLGNCSPAAILCGLVIIPVILLSLPGGALFGVGTYALWSDGRNYRKVQKSLGIFLVVYCSVFAVLWLLLVY